MKQQQATLRPGDIAVALELVLRPGERYEELSRALGLSLSAAHRAVGRLDFAGLLLPTGRYPNKSTLLDFLTHGVRYAFPARLGGQTRGVPTAHAGPPLAKMFGGDPVVWPSVDGTVRGDGLVPLYPAAPRLAERVPDLYELLTLVDAIRVGQARERARAAALLRERFGLL